VGAGAQLLVLGKISAILDAFSLDAPELSLADIRAATGLPASTTQRLVANLVSAGFLDRRDDLYRVGVRMSYWAAPAAQGADTIDVVQPVLRALRDETGETAAFYRGHRTLRICIAVAETRHSLRRALQIGDVAPIHVGSSGRVLLAFDRELAESVLSAPLDRLTPQTVTDPDILRRMLEETRANGFAMTVGERESAASGMSAPVFDAHGRTRGAISVMGPSFRMPPDVMAGWLDALVGSAERVTRMLGGRGPGGI
jgi:DNA-binding IclR family transcriptional regulator